jgi:surface antigen
MTGVGMRALWLFAVCLLLNGCSGGGHLGPSYLVGATSLECAPYARLLTGIALYGDADRWWIEAAGRYTRAAAPGVGGVLVFRPSDRLPSGHVAVVHSIVNRREILVDQANWVHHEISRGEPVIDVSPGNDWTQVRVWWSLSRQFGTTIYPAYGFILPERSRVAALAP